MNYSQTFQSHQREKENTQSGIYYRAAFPIQVCEGVLVRFRFVHLLSSLAEHPLSFLAARHRCSQKMPPSREDGTGRECVKAE